MPRSTLAPVLAVVALALGACGASGSDDDADDTTTTAVADDADTSTTEDEQDDTTTTTEESASGDLVDVEVWAEQFCGDFEGWLDAITAAGESVGDAVQPGDIEGAKTAIVGLFDDVADETDTFIEALEEGGAPDIDDGEAFLDDLVEKFEAFRDAMVTAGDQAEAADTSDPAAFQATITELISDFQTETETVGASFSELDAVYGDRDLDAAVDEACTFM
jgi:hypothetical protein